MQPLSHLGNSSCTLCPLYQGAKSVCVMGNGSILHDLMIIGEAPGANEDEIGEPFVGRAGEVLNQTLGLVGLQRDNVYVTNIVKCRPPGNRNPKQEEIDACLDYLIAEYNVVKPEIVVLMGNTALHSLTSITKGITRARGFVPGFQTALIHSLTFATFHPSAAARFKNVREQFEKDFYNIAKAHKRVCTRKLEESAEELV